MLASRRLAKSLESQIQIGSERMPPLVRLVDTLWEVMISTQDLKSSHQSSISSIADHAVVRKGVPGTSSIRNSIRHRSIRAMIGSWLPSGAFSQPVTTRENVLALAADSELIFIAVEGLRSRAQGRARRVASLRRRVSVAQGFGALGDTESLKDVSAATRPPSSPPSLSAIRRASQPSPRAQ